MITPQLQEYIKNALASGQSREAITQSLIQNGWKAEDIEAGFGATTPTTPMPPMPTPIMVSSVPTHSKMPMILGIVAILIVLGATGGWVWSNKQVKNNTVKIPDTMAPVTTTIPVAATITEAAQATSTPEKSASATTTPVVKITTASMKSETDVYGTNLYSLKEGQTVRDLGEKSVVTGVFNDKKVTEVQKTIVTYIRSGDSISVKEEMTTPHSNESYSTTVMLNAVQNYMHNVSSAKSKIEQSCPNSDTTECQLILGWMRAIEECSNIKTDKAMNICMGSYNSTGIGYSRVIGFGGGSILWGLLGYGQKK